MTSATALGETSAAQNTLTMLANVYSPTEDAVSLYFCYPEVSDKAHRKEKIIFGELVRGVLHDATTKTNPLLKGDLEEIFSTCDKVRREPNRLHVIFACRNQGIWQEFDLPVSVEQTSLRRGNHFRLLPLIRALESTTPYGVALIETGKARAFVIRGDEIEEIFDLLPSKDLSVHVQDSRTRWSSHIEHNRIERTKAYFKDLVHRISEFMTQQGISHLIIGCRERLWREIEAYFTGLERKLLIGRFTLPDFEIHSGEVLNHAAPIFTQGCKSRVEEILNKLDRTPSRSAYGLNDVSQALGEGRVQTLVLGQFSDRTLSNCNSCGKICPNDGKTCVFCGSRDLCILTAEEALLREALRTGAEILFVEEGSTLGFQDAAASLRY